MKAEVIVSMIEVNGSQVFGHAVQLGGQGGLHHFIAGSDIKSMEQYRQTILEQYPHYMFEEYDQFITEEQTFEQAPPAPGLDQDTGELKNESINNNTKTSNMENKNKVTFGRKVQWYSAKTAGITVMSIMTPVHVVLQTVADVTQGVANAAKNSEAFAIDKLNIADNTRDEIKDSILNRTRKVQKYVAMPVTIPVGLGSSLVNSLKQKYNQPKPEVANAI